MMIHPAQQSPSVHRCRNIQQTSRRWTLSWLLRPFNFQLFELGCFLQTIDLYWISLRSIIRSGIRQFTDEAWFFLLQTKVGKLFKHLTNQTTCALPFFGGKWFLCFLVVLFHSSYSPLHETLDPGWTFVDLPRRSLHQVGTSTTVRPPQIYP